MKWQGFHPLGESDNSVNHITRKCSKLIQSEYKTNKQTKIQKTENTLLKMTP